MNEETLASIRADAYDQKRLDRQTYDGEIECLGCGQVWSVLLNNSDGEPHWDPEECEECGSEEWEHV